MSRNVYVSSLLLLLLLLIWNEMMTMCSKITAEQIILSFIIIIPTSYIHIIYSYNWQDEKNQQFAGEWETIQQRRKKMKEFDFSWLQKQCFACQSSLDPMLLGIFFIFSSFLANEQNVCCSLLPLLILRQLHSASEGLRSLYFSLPLIFHRCCVTRRLLTSLQQSNWHPCMVIILVHPICNPLHSQHCWRAKFRCFILMPPPSPPLQTKQKSYACE